MTFVLYWIYVKSYRNPSEQWSKMFGFLRGRVRVVRRTGSLICKRFTRCCRSGLRGLAHQWRMLPSEYGKWNSGIYKRFARWCDSRSMGVVCHQHFVCNPDMDSPHHRQYELVGLGTSFGLPGAPPKRGARHRQALGRSRGGFTKGPCGCRPSLGNPLRFTLTGGQEHDVTQASS